MIDTNKRAARLASTLYLSAFLVFAGAEVLLALRHASILLPPRIIETLPQGGFEEAAMKDRISLQKLLDSSVEANLLRLLVLAAVVAIAIGGDLHHIATNVGKSFIQRPSVRLGFVAFATSIGLWTWLRFGYALYAATSNRVLLEFLFDETFRLRPDQLAMRALATEGLSDSFGVVDIWLRISSDEPMSSLSVVSNSVLSKVVAWFAGCGVCIAVGASHAVFCVAASEVSRAIRNHLTPDLRSPSGESETYSHVGLLNEAWRRRIQCVTKQIQCIAELLPTCLVALFIVMTHIEFTICGGNMPHASLLTTASAGLVLSVVARHRKGRAVRSTAIGHAVRLCACLAVTGGTAVLVAPSASSISQDVRAPFFGCPPTRGREVRFVTVDGWTGYAEVDSSASGLSVEMSLPNGWAWLSLDAFRRTAAGGAFDRGVQVGSWTYRYADGAVVESRFDSDGVRHGNEVVRWPTGIERSRQSFLRGLKHGEGCNRWPNGNVWASGCYRYGRAEGNWTYHYPDGAFAASGFFKAGKVVGDWEICSRSGVFEILPARAVTDQHRLDDEFRQAIAGSSLNEDERGGVKR
jgi:hypothetical protein